MSYTKVNVGTVVTPIKEQNPLSNPKVAHVDFYVSFPIGPHMFVEQSQSMQQLVHRMPHGRSDVFAVGAVDTQTDACRLGG